MIDKNRLATKCSTWNIELTGTQLDLLDKYAELLVSYNEKVNLTAITSPEGIEDRHFADSLLPLELIPEGANLIDVGTGAGFPGVPLLILRDDITVTLLDGLNKRLTFLDALTKALGLSGRVALLHARAEDAGRDPAHRGKYDVALTRAVASLPVLLELTVPLLRVGAMALLLWYV